MHVDLYAPENAPVGGQSVQVGQEQFPDGAGGVGEHRVVVYLKGMTTQLHGAVIDDHLKRARVGFKSGVFVSAVEITGQA